MSFLSSERHVAPTYGGRGSAGEIAGHINDFSWFLISGGTSRHCHLLINEVWKYRVTSSLVVTCVAVIRRGSHAKHAFSLPPLASHTVTKNACIANRERGNSLLRGKAGSVWQ